MTQLKVTPNDDPGEWEQDSGLGELHPSKYLTLKSAFERALEFERIAVKSYNDLANTDKDKDHDFEDILAKLPH